MWSEPFQPFLLTAFPAFSESSHWGWYSPLVQKACLINFHSLHGNQHILGPQEALLQLKRPDIGRKGQYLESVFI